MPRRHPPIPRIWLMTDERMGDALWDTVARLPRGAGIVFRHYGLPDAARRAAMRRLARIAKARGLLLVRAGGEALPGEAGVHGRRGRGVQTWPAHSRREAVAGVRAGAEALFVSPVFATRSHPGARTLGRARLGLLISGLGVPVIALGGMDAKRAAGLRQLGVHGWAGIDAWTAPDQKRKAVPI